VAARTGGGVLSAVLWLIGGLAIGYLGASLLESTFHEYVSDAPQGSVRRWRRHPWLLKQLIETNFSHHTIHHVRTYRRDHITQFRSAEEQAKLDLELERTPHGIAVRKALYGNTFSPMGWVAFTAPLVPISVACALTGGAWFALGAAIASFASPFLSNFVHPYLHLPYEVARATAPWPVSWLLGTRYLRAVTRHHFLHHRYPNKNFNLLLGGDWIRRRVRRANDRDLAEMARLGLRLD
jgi:hypothetical protein